MTSFAPDDSIRTILADGVDVVPGILERETALGLRPLLQSAIDEDLRTLSDRPGYIDGWMVQNLMVRGEPFLRLLENERLHAVLSGLLGDTCIVYAYTSSSMPPSGANFSRRIHVDSPRLIPGYVTNVGVMIALDDFSPENGATEFLAGSQAREQTPSVEEFDANAKRVYPTAGDAIFFNARTWHRGGLNTTSSPRHALTMNVCRSYMRQRFDYPRLVGPELAQTLGPVGRRFLGFNVRMPQSLDEYYVPEDQRLYKGGQG